LSRGVVNARTLFSQERFNYETSAKRAVVVIGFPWKRGVVVEIAGAAGDDRHRRLPSELRAARRGLACRLGRRGTGQRAERSQQAPLIYRRNSRIRTARRTDERARVVRGSSTTAA